MGKRSPVSAEEHPSVPVLSFFFNIHISRSIKLFIYGMATSRWAGWAGWGWCACSYTSSCMMPAPSYSLFHSHSVNVVGNGHTAEELLVRIALL